MNKFALTSLVLLGLMACMNAGATATSPQSPNVLFVAFDDLRPLIGAYGEAEPITPNLDALAQDATRFDRAYVSYPLCNPSRASMLTGIRFDLQESPRKNNKHPKLIAKQDTWPRVLKQHGYWTATRGKLYHGDVPNGDKNAWHIPGKFWGEVKDGGPTILPKIVEMGGRADQIADYKKKGAGPGALMYAAVDGPDTLLNDGKVAADVVDFLKHKRDKSKPFMIAAGFSRPHMPWVAPKKYFDLYPDDAGTLADFPEGAKDAFDMAKYKSKTRDHGWNEGVDDPTAKKLIRGYMASTSFADAQMGKIIQALKDEGLYEDTIIIAWGDHGYHLTDQGLWRKNTPFHISLRSPLLIKAPGFQSGTVSSEVVQNIDLYPTLLELAGIEKPEHLKLHGNSLVPLLRGETAKWNNMAFTSAKGSHGVVTEKYRYTKMSDGSRRLYDLEADPGEWQNLSGDKQYSNLMDQFDKHLRQAVWNKPE